MTLTSKSSGYTFAQAYAAAGKTQTSGYYKMQDMSSAICADVTDGQTGTLIDIRNGNKTYTVGKFLDKCWMTQNLDLPGGTTLSHADTNVPENYSTTTTGFVNGNTLPASSTSGFSSNTTAYVYNSGSTTCGSNSPCYSYYSWLAATAGYNPESGEATGDICPSGWHLPTQAEFDTLRSTYTTGATLTASPFLGVYDGNYYSSSFSYGGSSGYYWSSTAYVWQPVLSILTSLKQLHLQEMLYLPFA